MTDGNTTRMEFRHDPDRPDTYLIDGVKFSGDMLRQMTQPDPTRILSFQREGDKVILLDTTQMRKDNERTIESLKKRVGEGEAELHAELERTRTQGEHLQRQRDEATENLEKTAAGLRKAADELIDERNEAFRLEKEAEVMKKQLEEAASGLEEGVAVLEQFKRRYEGQRDALEKANKRIKILVAQVDVAADDDDGAGG